jgi:hypothetical protein
MLNIYMRFKSHAVTTQAPLHYFFAGPRFKGSHPIIWTTALSTVFEGFNASLYRAAILAHPESSTRLALVTDALTTAMGAMLQQSVMKAWQHLVFFSRKSGIAKV